MTAGENPDFSKMTLSEFLEAKLHAPTPPTVQLDVALRYHKGEWIERRDEHSEKEFLNRGVHIISHAAERGNTEAQCALGVIYCYGRPTGGLPDYEGGVPFLMKAASKQDATAQMELQALFQSSMKVIGPKSRKKILKMLENLPPLPVEPDFDKTTLAAFLQKNLRNPQTELDVAMRYYKGEWKEYRDADSEREFSIRGTYVIEKAAKECNVDAQYAMGEMNWTGSRMNQNFDEAVKWFTQAAEQGHEEARKKLYEADRQNWGMPKNPVERSKIIILSKPPVP